MLHKISIPLIVILIYGIIVQLPAQKLRTDASLFQQRVEEMNRVLEKGEMDLAYLKETVENLMRIASERDREKIRKFLANMEPKVEAVRVQFQALKQNVKNGSVNITEVKSSVESIVTPLVREIKEFQKIIRERIMTVKRAGYMINVTERAMYRSARLARKTENGIDAFPGLRKAFELQEEAKKALAEGNPKLAVKLTIKARDLIGETITAALDSTDIEMVKKRAVKYFRHTQQMIKRISAKTDPDNDPRVAKRLKMAKEEQERAKQLVEEHPYRALRHARNARRIVNEILRFQNRLEHFDERVERIEEKSEMAEEIVKESGDPKAAEILEKGTSHLEKGKELGEAGNSKAATAQLDIAVKLVAKAVDIAKGNTPKTHAVNREIKKTALIVNKAADIAETDKDKEAVKRARAMIAEAEERKENPSVALKLLDKATDIAFRLISLQKPENLDNNTENNKQ